MYIITYAAINNNTYEKSMFTLYHPIDPYDEKAAQSFFFYRVPDDIKKVVESTYDGVWDPQLETIEIYKVEKVS